MSMHDSVSQAGLKPRLYDPPLRLQLADGHAHAASDAVLAHEHVDVHRLRLRRTSLCRRGNTKLTKYRPCESHAHDANRFVGHDRSADDGNGRVLTFSCVVRLWPDR